MDKQHNRSFPVTAGWFPMMPLLLGPKSWCSPEIRIQTTRGPLEGASVPKYHPHPRIHISVHAVLTHARSIS